MVTPTNMHDKEHVAITWSITWWRSFKISRHCYFGYFTIARFVVMFISTTNRRQACEKKGRNGPPIRRTRTSQDTLRSNIFFKLYWVSFQKKKTVILLRHDPHVRKWQTACKACSYEGSSLAMADEEDVGKRRFRPEPVCRCFQVLWREIKMRKTVRQIPTPETTVSTLKLRRVGLR